MLHRRHVGLGGGHVGLGGGLRKLTSFTSVLVKIGNGFVSCGVSASLSECSLVVGMRKFRFSPREVIIFPLQDTHYDPSVRSGRSGSGKAMCFSRLGSKYVLFGGVAADGR